MQKLAYKYRQVRVRVRGRYSTTSHLPVRARETVWVRRMVRVGVCS